MDLVLHLFLGLVAATALTAFVFFADRVAGDVWGKRVEDPAADRPLRLALLALSPEEFAHFGLARVDEAARVTATVASRGTKHAAPTSAPITSSHEPASPTSASVQIVATV